MLAHASPNDGVNKLGISFTMFKQPFDLVDPSKKNQTHNWSSPN